MRAVFGLINRLGDLFLQDGRSAHRREYDFRKSRSSRSERDVTKTEQSAQCRLTDLDRSDVSPPDIARVVGKNPMPRRDSVRRDDVERRVPDIGGPTKPDHQSNRAGSPDHGKNLGISGLTKQPLDPISRKNQREHSDRTQEPPDHHRAVGDVQLQCRHSRLWIVLCPVFWLPVAGASARIFGRRAVIQLFAVSHHLLSIVVIELVPQACGCDVVSCPFGAMARFVRLVLVKQILVPVV